MKKQKKIITALVPTSQLGPGGNGYKKSRETVPLTGRYRYTVPILSFFSMAGGFVFISEDGVETPGHQHTHGRDYRIPSADLCLYESTLRQPDLSKIFVNTIAGSFRKKIPQIELNFLLYIFLNFNPTCCSL